jgi:diaminopimelate decarboxylase
MNRPGFSYRHGYLFVEDVDLREIAERHGTPCYVYSRAALTAAFESYRSALHNATTQEAMICYAVKANSNLAILNLFARLGAGFDIVSGGELTRVTRGRGRGRENSFSQA